MAFRDVSEEERTDESFRQYQDHEHHKGATLLRKIVPPINMILTFVLDFMHLGFLGVTLKLLDHWFSSLSRFRTGQRERAKITRRLQQMKNQMPQEFQRKIRGINEYATYKATELNFFLFYAGPIVLKKIIPIDQYDNFNSFHYASRLLWSEKTAQENVNASRAMLKLFFEQCKRIYHQSSATMNMHNLNHVADDVVHSGMSLSEINAFSYENYLGIIKKKIRSPYRLLAQICRRNHESRNLDTKAKLIPEIEVLKRGAGNGITKLRYKGKYLATKRPDNIILLKNNHIMEIQRIFQENGDISMQGLRWMPEEPIYHNRLINSANQNMYELNNEALPRTYRWHLNQVEAKLVRLDVDLEEDGGMKKFVIPLLHE